MFDSDAGLTFRDMKDGASKIILIVEVPPDDAVIWTKPDDWEVDLSNPLRGVTRSDRNYVTAAWGDGHVQTIPTDVKPDLLKAYLTRAGGEAVDSP